MKLLIKTLFKNYRHLLLLLYYLLIGFLYTSLNKHVQPQDIEVLMNYPPIDSHIPFIKYMIIPYILWYPYIVLPLVYFAFKDKDAYFKLCAFLFVGMTICYIIYYLIPNGIGLGFRPEITENDIFSRILKSIYQSDNPTNSCPSIHVLNTIAIHTSITHSKSFGNNKLVKHISLILSIFICSSTVMVKQHSIIDIIASLILSSVLYLVIYSKSNSTSSSNHRLHRYQH